MSEFRSALDDFKKSKAGLSAKLASAESSAEESISATDELKGRVIIPLNQSAKKGKMAKDISFAINETTILENKKIFRNANDPNSGSFYVLNFKRFSRQELENATKNKKDPKPFEFNVYEHYASDLLEGLCRLVDCEKQPNLVITPLEALPKRKGTDVFSGSYDVSEFGEPM